MDLPGTLEFTRDTGAYQRHLYSPGTPGPARDTMVLQEQWCLPGSLKFFRDNRVLQVCQVKISPRSTKDMRIQQKHWVPQGYMDTFYNIQRTFRSSKDTVILLGPQGPPETLLSTRDFWLYQGQHDPPWTLESTKTLGSARTLRSSRDTMVHQRY